MPDSQIGIPERPKPEPQLPIARWGLLPTNGKPFHDRRLVVEVRAPEWKMIAELLAGMNFGLLNSCKGAPNIAGFRGFVFAEVDSADSRVTEELVVKALHRAGFPSQYVKRIHVRKVLDAFGNDLEEHRNGDGPPA